MWQHCVVVTLLCKEHIYTFRTFVKKVAVVQIRVKKIYTTHTSTWEFHNGILYHILAYISGDLCEYSILWFHMPIS